MANSVVTLTLQDGNERTGLLYAVDPETEIYYLLCAAENHRFTMLVVPSREVQHCSPVAAHSREAVLWADTTANLLRQHSHEVNKRDLLSLLQASGEDFVDEGDRITVGSGQALFLQPFTLDKVTFENAAAEEAMRPLLERLEVWLAKESSGECAAGTERGLGVLVNGNKVLYRSEVDLPHLSPYAPSQKEMTGGTSNSNRRPADVPKKYWAQRFELFSRFNQGIRLDEESWYSVTPEPIAEHIAERCRCCVIVDLFCGAGGNAIQFAFTCEQVIAVDIDPEKLACARHNAKVYGVEERIEWVQADAIELLKSRAFAGMADVVFCSPPWGGPSYGALDTFDLDNVFVPSSDSKVSFTHILRLALDTTQNVALFLPRNTLPVQCASAAQRCCEFEEQRMGNKTRTCTAYYGELLVQMRENPLH